MNNSLLTTITFDGAFSLYKASKDIIDEKVKTVNLVIPCNGASLTLKRELNNMTNQYETMLIINKNNKNIAFKFQTLPVQVTDDSGAQKTKIIESGLGAFMKTIEGYLTGINSERHLNKLTEDFAAQQSQKPQNNRPQTNCQQNNGYRNNNYRNNNNRPWQNKPKPNNNWGPAQNFNDYSVQN